MQSLKTVSASKRTDPQKSVQDKLLIEKIKIYNITYIYMVSHTFKNHILENKYFSITILIYEYKRRKIHGRIL